MCKQGPCKFSTIKLTFALVFIPCVPICRCCTLLTYISCIFKNVFLYFDKSLFHAEISTTNLTLALCCCNRKAVCADFISSSSSSSSSLSSTNEQTRCRLSHLLFVFWGGYCLPVCLFCVFFVVDFFVMKQSSIFLQSTHHDIFYVAQGLTTTNKLFWTDIMFICGSILNNLVNKV